jgi:hypothetical protein
MTNEERERLNELHQDIILELDEVILSEKDNRDQAIADRRFIGVAGGAWEDFYEEVWDDKPKMEVDKVSIQISRIEGEYRRNKIDQKFASMDTTYDLTARSATDLFRACRNEEGSDEAECNSFSEALRGGFGAFRISVVKADNEKDQSKREIIFEPIFDADSSVYFDPNAKRQDKMDADWAVVITGMTPRAFKKKYPDASQSSVNHRSELNFDWYRPERVFIAEYYGIETKSTRLVTFLSLSGQEEKYTKEQLTPEFLQDLEDSGYVTDDPKGEKIEVRKVHKYILSGSEILEDCGFIAGNQIPIIPVYGERFYIEGVERFHGKVRKTKDIVRIKNAQLSKLVEGTAYSPLEKPIFIPEQIRGHESLWETDHMNDYAYLLLNPVTDTAGNKQPMGAVGYSRPPQLSSSLTALMTVSDTDLSDVMGIQQGGEAIVSNISGKAVELIQNKISQGSFIFLSNMSKALKRASEVFLSILRDVHTEPGTKLTGLDKLNKRTEVEIGKLEKSGDRFITSNDFTVDLYSVVTLGPPSDSKREGIVRSLMELLQLPSTDPELGSLLISEILLNLEGSDGLEDIQKFVRKNLIKKGVVQPTPEEATDLQAELEKQPTNPQDEFLKAQAAKTMADIESGKVKDQKVMIDIEKTKADIAKVESDIAKSIQEMNEKSEVNTLMLIAKVDEMINRLTPPAPAPAPYQNPALQFPPGVRGMQPNPEIQ